MSQPSVTSRVQSGVNHWLIHQAARRAPALLSQRLEEEWLADLAARPTASSRLRFAIGCCWATGVIALEYQPSSVPAAGSVMDGRLMSAQGQDDSGYFSRRSGTFFMVVSLHAVLFYVLLATLPHPHGKAVTEPLQNRALEDLHPRRPLPTPPTPQFTKDFKIHAKRPEPLVPPDPDPIRDVAAIAPQDPVPPDPQPRSPHVVQQVQGGPGTGFPNPDDFYPISARHMEEQGVAVIKVCVDPHGRLTADPVTLQGSGSTRLDEGALTLARAGSGHYRPTTEDGQPVSSCYPVRIRFQIKN